MHMHQANEIISSLSVNVVYLMGGSFLLGSLFTIFVLLILEMLRLRYEPAEDLPPEEDLS